MGVIEAGKRKRTKRDRDGGRADIGGGAAATVDGGGRDKTNGKRKVRVNRGGDADRFNNGDFAGSGVDGSSTGVAVLNDDVIGIGGAGGVGRGRAGINNAVSTSGLADTDGVAGKGIVAGIVAFEIVVGEAVDGNIAKVDSGAGRERATVNVS